MGRVGISRVNPFLSHIWKGRFFETGPIVILAGFHSDHGKNEGWRVTWLNLLVGLDGSDNFCNIVHLSEAILPVEWSEGTNVKSSLSSPETFYFHPRLLILNVPFHFSLLTDHDLSPSFPSLPMSGLISNPPSLVRGDKKEKVGNQLKAQDNQDLSFDLSTPLGISLGPFSGSFSGVIYFIHKKWTYAIITGTMGMNIEGEFFWGDYEKDLREAINRNAWKPTCSFTSLSLFNFFPDRVPRLLISSTQLSPDFGFISPLLLGNDKLRSPRRKRPGNGKTMKGI